MVTPIHIQQQSAKEFHALMNQLLRFMKMRLPAPQNPEVYSLTFDGKIEVNIFSRVPGTLDMLTKPGLLRNRKADTVLSTLLGMNNFWEDDGSFASVGLDPVSGNVTLWSRHSLSNLHLDALAALLRGFLNKAWKIHWYLEKDDRPVQGARRHPSAGETRFRPQTVD